jgi:hypothetical protein
MRRVFAIACLVALLVLLAASGASAARPPRSPTRLVVNAPDAHSLVATWAWQPNTTYEVRFRAHAGRWRGQRAGTGGRVRLSGLSPATVSYEVEVRGCQRRCSAWSAPVGKGVPGSSGGLPASGPASATRIGGCSVFPANNPWNQDVSQLPVDPNSAHYIASINGFGDTNLHADFGADPTYGIPFRVVASASLRPVTFTEYGSESDPGPYPIPTDTPIEAGSDHHVLVVDSNHCKLYELYHAQPNAGGGWNAGSGAVFNLSSNLLRPDTWTSTDQAGLPILPGLARYEEVAAGAINHALRFTVAQTQHAFIHPATHYGSSENPNDPPMGTRLRLRADFDLTSFHGEALVVLQALKRYGMFVADTGTSWFVSGATDPRWNEEDLDQLKTVPGSAFEVVQTGPLHRP